MGTREENVCTRIQVDISRATWTQPQTSNHVSNGILPLWDCLLLGSHCPSHGIAMRLWDVISSMPWSWESPWHKWWRCSSNNCNNILVSFRGNLTELHWFRWFHPQISSEKPWVFEPLQTFPEEPLFIGATEILKAPTHSSTCVTGGRW